MLPLNRLFCRNAALILCALFFLPLQSFAQHYYKWVDSTGTVHFADSPESVPPRYRKETKKSRLEQSGDIFQTEKKKAENPLEKKIGANGGTEGKSYKIPYISFEGTARRVIVDVTLNEKITAPMALDTGSPGMIISPGLARRIGVFEDGGGRMAVLSSGIGGAVPAVRTVVNSLAIGGVKDSFIPTVVTNIKSKAFDGLIGMDLMGRYSVNIQSDRNIVIFTEITSGGTRRPGGHDKRWWRSNFREFNRYRKAWEEYAESIEQEIENRKLNGQSGILELKKVAKHARQQAREAGKLFQKLDLYASRLAVPMKWREY